MKIVAVASAKGGVGKTTVVANLAAALARSGARVLVVDLDPQNALGLHFGMAPDEVAGLSRAALGGQPWDSAAFQADAGLRVLPYGTVEEADRQAFERMLEATPGWLSGLLANPPLPDDALVILDTPPGPSPYMSQALSTAHLGVVVTLPDAASYASVPAMHRLIRTYGEPRPDYAGTFHVLNQVDPSRPLARDIAELMREQFPGQLLGTVHEDAAVSEALASHQCLFDYDPHGQATQDLLACARRLAEALEPGLPRS